MSTSTNNLFAFGRHLPSPFDSLTGNGVRLNVSSRYGNGTTATLCASIIKAVHALCDYMDGTSRGAVGTIDHRTVAEYKSSVEDEYHLVVYDGNTGNVSAGVYNTKDGGIATYVMNASARDGAAVLLAMTPYFLHDEEFKEKFDAYHAERQRGYPDMDEATNLMGVLCDNVYRRVKDPSCSAHLRFTAELSGRLTRIGRASIDAGTFSPTSVIAGEFTIVARSGATGADTEAVIIDRMDFSGKFQLHPREFTLFEQALIPKLPEWYIIPQEVIDICKHAHATTGKPAQMRNFLLRGPAGTGKTMGAKAVAAGLGLPYMKYTCSASTEIYDFIGQIFPDSERATTGDAGLDNEREQLKAMGGITYENVKKLMNLPELDDMDYDPAGVYKSLTGRECPSATSQDCMRLVLEKVTAKIAALSVNKGQAEQKGQTFSYIETDFIKALKNGYLVEVQEPSTIMQPGVLVGLNSLLEQDGAITLPTGEVITRHPDAVVVVTTNISYEGCRGINQSIIDRMSLVKDIELPNQEVMVRRAMAVTGFNDELTVSKMVKVVNDMADYCRKNSITDGAVGMRSLIDWIASSEITGDVYSSALSTVISKATANEDDREALVVSVLEPVFAPLGTAASV